MKITAAVAREVNAPLSIEEVELDDPRDDEILVKLVATGVCHTDMAVMEGLMGTEFPVVLGHEGAGTVERVGSAITKVKPGDQVVMTMDSCGHCPACANHDNVYCHNFGAMNMAAMPLTLPSSVTHTSTDKGSPTSACTGPAVMPPGPWPICPPS